MNIFMGYGIIQWREREVTDIGERSDNLITGGPKAVLLGCPSERRVTFL